MWSLFRRKSPLTILSFDRQRPLFWQDRKEWAVGGNLRLRRIRNGPTAQERMGLRRKKARLRRANKKTVAGQAYDGWQGMRDSNPRKRSQSPVCYRYTNPLFVLCVKTQVLLY